MKVTTSIPAQTCSVCSFPEHSLSKCSTFLGWEKKQKKTETSLNEIVLKVQTKEGLKQLWDLNAQHSWAGKKNKKKQRHHWMKLYSKSKRKRVSSSTGIEWVPETSKYSSEDELALQHFEDSCIIQPDECYSVILPRREKLPSLGTSRNTAMRRFIQNERSLQSKRKLKAYNEVMREYLPLNHVERVPENRSIVPSTKFSTCLYKVWPKNCLQPHSYVQYLKLHHIHPLVTPWMTSSQTRYGLLIDAPTPSRSPHLTLSTENILDEHKNACFMETENATPTPFDHQVYLKGLTLQTRYGLLIAAPTPLTD